MFRCLECENELILSETNLSCNNCHEKYKFDRENNIYSIVKPQQTELIESVNFDWNEHWKDTDSAFHKLKQFMRIYMSGLVLKKALIPFLDGKDKVFLEAGSGLSETSSILNFSRNIYISLDISNVALQKNINKQIKLQGDLFNIPVLPEKIDYIFNVGVHEHYTDEQNKEILTEFHRVLNEGGKIILLWPLYYGPLMVLAKVINWVLTLLLKRKFEIWPNQVNEIRSLKYTDNLISKSGFQKLNSFMSIYDLFSTQVLIYKKT